MLLSTTLLADTAQRLRSAQLDLFEYINALCDRIETHEPDIKALIPEEQRRERLLREALLLQAQYPDPATRPPLYGITVGVKDIFHVNGFPTKAGSLLPEELFEGPEASCVSRLKQAGALIAGKTVTTEFAYFEPGPTRNPHNPKHTPGGSSSGSAAGVASGFFPLSFGTQTIGSVIRPAAFCGIVGFKPTFNRIPTDGLLIFSKSADHVGLFTQDIEGMELAASLLCRQWRPVRACHILPVLGVPEGRYLVQATDLALIAFENQIALLEQAGYCVKRIAMFEDIDVINARHRLMTAAEAAQEHEAWFQAHHKLYRPRTAEVILKGRKVSPEQLWEARQGCAQLRHYLSEQRCHYGVDIWISPAATGEAPIGLEATGDPIMNLPWTHAGLPVITVPAGFTKNRLPLGLQCAADVYQDEKLLFWMHRVAEVLKY
ncbi:amidase [candidate division KSB3 bacterium]|uniref:Amidase n=1 Tax=candidate division KSB3 bacterium TaxID=2044937 RepID=A0A2G6E2Y9_9BACT|nr:MAG: amidase [candidate division KSB3 bacterium]PIE28845.1 MAG: amidase [candidate division KSB3 bacterium]